MIKSNPFDAAQKAKEIVSGDMAIVELEQLERADLIAIIVHLRHAFSALVTFSNALKGAVKSDCSCELCKVLRQMKH